MNKLYRVIVSILLISVFFAGCKDSDVNDPPNSQPEEITIAALLSLTGNWSALGITSKAALEIGIDRINKKFADEGKNIRFKLKVIDTELNPDIAYSKTSDLISEGIKIIIGPQSSAELKKIKPLLDSRDIFAVSMGSTAGSLAFEGDHILRYCPDDKPEGKAIARLMWERGIRNIVAVYRDDEGNIGLKKSMASSFTALGGTVSDSVKYPDTDIITDNIVESISQKAAASGSLSTTGIYLAGFDEIKDIFIKASGDTVLNSLLWFGSNGSANSQQVINNTEAAGFANKTTFCSPLFDLSAANQSEWGPVAAQIKQSTGIDADAYSLASYDALWTAYLVYKDLGSNIPFTEFFTGYVTRAASYEGFTGKTELNAAGDRKYGNFTLLGICIGSGGFQWKSVGSYANDVLVYSGCN